jgi:hypothetical protein
MRSARRRRRSSIRLALAGVAGLLALLLLWWLAVPCLVQQRAMQAIDEAGLGPARIELAWRGPATLRAAPVQLGPSAAITIDSADLSVTPLGLAAGRIDALTLRGLHVGAAIDSSGRITLKDLPPPTLSGGDSGPVSLPVARLTLEDARLELATPAGPAAVRLDGTIRSGPEGPALDSALGISFGTARLSLPTLAIEPGPSGSWHVRTEHAEASDSDAHVTLQEIGADLDWNGTAATLDVKIGAIADMNRIARFPPLAGELHAERKGDGVAFSVAAADDRSRLRLSAKGGHSLQSGRGSAQLTVTIPPFHPESFQPRDLAPALARDLPPIEGRVGVSGPISWTGTRLEPRLLLSLSDFGGTFGAVRLSGGHGALLLDRLSPPATPPGQLFAAVLSLGDTVRMPLEARLQLRRDGMVAVDSLSIGLADGTLTTGDLAFAPGAGLPPEIAVPVQVGNVELGELLKLVDIDGLDGKGQLDGLLPLRLVTGTGGTPRLLLQQGRLEARGPGTLRYAGAGLPQQGSGSGAQSVALLRDALEDFHYRSLSAELDQGPDGAGGILLHLDGSNPAVLNGRRFLLNIRLEANFDRLAQIFLSGLEAAQDLTRNSLAPRR